MTTRPPYAVVATDCDGTILRTDGTVSARTRAALERAETAGAQLILVTGRPPRWMPEVVEQVGHRGLAVCANGAMLYDLATERVVREFPIAAEVLTQIARVVRDRLPEAAFAVERSEGGFFSEVHYRTPVGHVNPDRRVSADELFAHAAAKLLCRHPELTADELLAEMSCAAGDLATLTHSSMDGLVEISAIGVDKATTLARVCAERGFGSADVISFGDMPNDVPMLTWAGHGVAVASAHPDAIAAADEVTASNDDDGVAIVLERLF